MTDPNGQLELTCTILHNAMMSGPQVYGAKGIADETSQYNSAGCTSADLLTKAQFAKMAVAYCPKGRICTTPKGIYGPKNKGTGKNNDGKKPTGGSMSTYMMIGFVGLLGVGAFVYFRK